MQSLISLLFEIDQVGNGVWCFEEAKNTALSQEQNRKVPLKLFTNHHIDKIRKCLVFFPVLEHGNLLEY